jgi:hypothetical protein
LLSKHLLTLLQLTRMALVFTAIADSLCTLLLSAQRRAGPGTSVWQALDPRQVVAIAAVSVGLYGFGMSLNDIIDRRRDRQISPGRPLPSGRVGVVAAHLVCGLLVLLALAGGSYYASIGGDYLTLTLIVGTGLLIAFYDLAGKYLVAPGLLALGLIRFFHALIPDPHVPLLWHPLWLLNHVAILSAVAYHWEEKRPPLTKIHWWTVFGLLALIDLMAIAVVAARRAPGVGLAQGLRVEPGLVLPILATIGFVLLAWHVRRRSATSREAGQAAMLYGLLWLIVYDAAFVAGYVRDTLATLAVLALLPVAYFAVRFMRWWSKLLTLSQRPAFKRAKT